MRAARRPTLRPCIRLGSRGARSRSIAAFVALLADRLTPGGVLVLTTPTIEYVHPENLSPALLAALAPGFHGFLLSPQAFGDLARSAGLTHIEVRTFGERQMLWASRSPLVLDFDDARMQSPYLDYMAARVAQARSELTGVAGLCLSTTAGTHEYGTIRAGAAARAIASCRSHREPRQRTSWILKQHSLEESLHATTLAEFGRIGTFLSYRALFPTARTIAQYYERDLPTAPRDVPWHDRAGASRGWRFAYAAFIEAISLMWPARVRGSGYRAGTGRRSLSPRTSSPALPRRDGIAEKPNGVRGGECGLCGQRCSACLRGPISSRATGFRAAPV